MRVHLVGFVGYLLLGVGQQLLAQSEEVRVLAIEDASAVVRAFKSINSSDIQFELSLNSWDEGGSTHGSGILVSKPKNNHLLILKSNYVSFGFFNTKFYMHSSDLFAYECEQYSTLNRAAESVDPYLSVTQFSIVYQNKVISTSRITHVDKPIFPFEEDRDSEIVDTYQSTLRMISKNCDSCSAFIDSIIQPWVRYADKVSDKLAPYDVSPVTRRPDFPLSEGTYQFVLRFAEHSAIDGPPLKVTIRGDSIYVDEVGERTTLSSRFVVSGLLLWHIPTGQWIIGEKPEDASADEVGGCSDGPLVIDPRFFQVWSC
jgi:hypothetical protein